MASETPTVTEKCLIVIGGGCAGFAAALQAAAEATQKDTPISVTLLEKTDKAGGNSANDSSGMNALNTSAGDSHAHFVSDVLQSGGGVSNQKLAELLVTGSQSALTFLSSYDVNLTAVSRLPGHSVPRTYFDPSVPNTGAALMAALIAAARSNPAIRILENTKAEEIIMEGGRVAGVRASTSAPDGGVESVSFPADAVIITTGGFAADRDRLAEVAPSSAGLPTSSGAAATGDGVRLAEAAGARTTQLEYVQVHPTGFVDPKDPSASNKVVAPERLRGVGALLVDSGGRRFADEMSAQNVLTPAIMKQKERTAFLVLPQAAAAKFGQKALDDYVARGLFTKAANASAASSSLNLPMLPMDLVFYNTMFRAAANLPAPKPGDEESFPVHDGFGRVYFPVEVAADAPLYLARVTPVIDTTLGGVESDESGRALSKEGGGPIPGLYVAGGASGGLHGKNRLGGNAILECVVFGRIAASSALTFVHSQ